MIALICGSTGMVGSLVLENCLQSDAITEVISLVRKPTNKSHPKLKEVIISDFMSYDNKSELFITIDVAYFCLGVYTGAVPDAKFKEITVDYAVEFAKLLHTNSPNAKLCLLSGMGADSTEKSRTSFAKYKGMAENQISALGLKFHTFRPGYIYPVTQRKEPNFMYRLSRGLYPLLKLFGKNASIKSTELAQAMFLIGLSKAQEEVWENKAIIEYLEQIN
jgi:uncharacterized protein YbjT (DUF2867 family)